MSEYIPIRGVADVTVTFSRFDYKNLSNSSVYGINSPSLWDRAAALFEAYAVKGFTLEYIPTNFVAVEGGAPILTSGYVYQDLNTYNIANYNDSQAEQSNGFQLINVNESWRISLDNAPLAKSQKSFWPATQ